MNWTVVFFLGLLIGEFLGKCAYRLPRHIALFRTGSFCPSCHMYLAPYFKIPLISYMFLKGRCFYCHFPISVRYPIIELSTALSGLALYGRFGFTGPFFFYGLFCCFLITISLIDAELQLIPNRLIVLMLVSGLAANLLLQVQPWSMVCLGAAMGGSVLALVVLLSKLLGRESLVGFGDIQLAAAAGIFLGPTAILFAILIGFLLAGVAGLLPAFLRNPRVQASIPFVPFLAIGMIVLLLWGAYPSGWPGVAELVASVP
ncbi:MAG: prepilin peptidase [Calditrichaeota bacterium]|nr:MAG: prepilin peptidase [Calditrichota bacterium]